MKQQAILVLLGVTPIACGSAATSQAQQPEPTIAQKLAEIYCVSDGDCPGVNDPSNPQTCIGGICEAGGDPGPPAPICTGCQSPRVCQGGACVCPASDNCDSSGSSGGQSSGGIVEYVCREGCSDYGDPITVAESFSNVRSGWRQGNSWLLKTHTTYVQERWCSTNGDWGSSYCYAGLSCDELKYADSFTYLGPSDSSPPPPPADWSELPSNTKMCDLHDSL